MNFINLIRSFFDGMTKYEIINSILSIIAIILSLPSFISLFQRKIHFDVTIKDFQQDSNKKKLYVGIEICNKRTNSFAIKSIKILNGSDIVILKSDPPAVDTKRLIEANEIVYLGRFYGYYKKAIVKNYLKLQITTNSKTFVKKVSIANFSRN